MKTRGWIAWLLALVFMLGMATTAVALVYPDDDVEYMYVTASTKKVKMFSEMSTKSSVLTKVPVGKKVAVFDMMPGSKWASVSYKGYYGYIQVKYLSTRKVKPTPKPTVKPVPKPTAKPTAKPVHFEDFSQVDYYVKITLSTPDAHMNMRWQPSTEADVVGVYANGTVLYTLQESKTWVEVMDQETNRVGYMMRKYLTKVESPVVGEEQEQTFDTELVVSPMNSMDSLESLQAALPNLYLTDAPEGTQNVKYDWINGEPVIAQILFEKDGAIYCYRAAHCESEAEMADIDGIFAEKHEESAENGLHLIFDEENSAAVAHYYSAAHQAQYSLAGPAANEGASVLEMAKAMFPAE